MLADVGLNIREAHVFSTTDGYSLDVFVVDGWPTEVKKQLIAGYLMVLLKDSLMSPIVTFLYVLFTSLAILALDLINWDVSVGQDIEDLKHALIQALSAMEVR